MCADNGSIRRLSGRREPAVGRGRISRSGRCSAVGQSARTVLAEFARLFPVFSSAGDPARTGRCARQRSRRRFVRRAPFFDEYAAEVRRHMLYEEEKVFSLCPFFCSKGVRRDGTGSIFSETARSGGGPADGVEEHPDPLLSGQRQQRTQQRVVRYFSCERDLASHNRIEDHLFVPAVVELERKNGSQ